MIAWYIEIYLVSLLVIVVAFPVQFGVSGAAEANQLQIEKPQDREVVHIQPLFQANSFLILFEKQEV